MAPDPAALPNFLPSAYPVNDYGPIMKGMAIGGLGIFHVFLAQFAIGGGFLLFSASILSCRLVLKKIETEKIY